MLLKTSNTAIMSCLLLVGMILGCSDGEGAKARPKTVKVVGTVTYKSKPVANATVVFTHESAPRAATGVTDANGKFTLGTFGNSDGAVPGEHVVTIVKKPAAAATVEPKKNADGTIAPIDPQEMMKMSAQLAANKDSEIPTKYGDPKETPLKLKVDEGIDNDIPIELTD